MCIKFLSKIVLSNVFQVKFTFFISGKERQINKSWNEKR